MDIARGLARIAVVQGGSPGRQKCQQQYGSLADHAGLSKTITFETNALASPVYVNPQSWQASARAQNLSSEDLARRTVECRALEAILWGTPIMI